MVASAFRRKPIENGPSCLQLYYKESPTQAFSCEYSEIFKNSFFKGNLLWLFLFSLENLLETTSKGYKSEKKF